MQIIIFAAGKGTRFGEITKKTPKCLLLVNKKPIIKYILESLPDDDSEIIVIIGHLHQMIKNYLGNKFRNHPIRYVLRKKITGTAGILWSIKDLIKDDFLVLNSDDITYRQEIKKLLKHPLSFGIIKGVAPSFKYRNVSLDKKKRIIGLDKIKEAKKLPIINIATGSYHLDKRIFRYKKVKLKNGEYGLPQTIIKMVKKHPVQGVLMSNTLMINNQIELKKAEKEIKERLKKK